MDLPLQNCASESLCPFLHAHMRVHALIIAQVGILFNTLHELSCIMSGKIKNFFRAPLILTFLAEYAVIIPGMYEGSRAPGLSALGIFIPNAAIQKVDISEDTVLSWKKEKRACSCASLEFISLWSLSPIMLDDILCHLEIHAPTYRKRFSIEWLFPSVY